LIGFLTVHGDPGRRPGQGSQCGFCTPGFIISTTALLNENPDPTDAEIRDALA
jgi:carbon-monoxide dehydrogenase small subunit